MWNAPLGQWCLLILESSIKCVHAQDVRLLVPFLNSPAYTVCLLDAFGVPDPVEQNLQENDHAAGRKPLMAGEQSHDKLTQRP